MGDEGNPLGRSVARSWGVDGISEEGSPGEECSVGINICADGTGFIVVYAEYATEHVQLSLTKNQVQDMIHLLT